MKNTETIMEKLEGGVIVARKTAAADAPNMGEPRQLHERAVDEAKSDKGGEELVPRCPGEDGALGDYDISRIRKAVKDWLARIIAERGAPVDVKYWDLVTAQILGTPSPDTATIVPARAGAGKSTWICAFLLALAAFFVADDPLADAIGGVLLVVQKVETLNVLVATLERAFPGQGTRIMAALQGWSASGQRAGYCANKSVERFDDCPRDNCPFAGRCEVLAFQARAASSFVAGITQARFAMLHKSGEGLERLLERIGTQGTRARRFLIFDEKFEMAPVTALRMGTLHAAGSGLERCITTHNVSDKKIRSMEAALRIALQRPFEKLRRETTVFSVAKNTIDLPFGMVSLAECAESDTDTLDEFARRFTGKDVILLNQPLRQAIEVIDALHKAPCLFTRQGPFAIFNCTPPKLTFGEAQTIVFDATAEVDGDYQYLDGVRWVDSSPALHLDCVTFHLFEHPDLNVAKTAMKKAWKLPAFAALIGEILAKHRGRTFLCTYKDFQHELLNNLAPEAAEHLALMPERSEPKLPYFGGTNGSNDFADCLNVILLGYPRLSPADYLARAYAYWGKAGLGHELADLQDRIRCEIEASGRPPAPDCLRGLPLLDEYIAHHLAARLEQEIYRCALRNQICDQEIRIFLFAPPTRVWKLLRDRFAGCRVERIAELPDCIELAKSGGRLYDGKATAFSKLAEFCAAWEGAEISPGSLRAQLDIPAATWHQLTKQPRTKALFDKHGIEGFGRGKNRVYRRKARVVG